jgi:hypothetical protein
MTTDNEGEARCNITGARECVLESVQKDVIELREEFIGVRKDLGSMGEKVLDHHKDLYGNGKAGLKEQMTRVSVKTSAILWMFGITIGLLVANLVKLFAG